MNVGDAIIQILTEQGDREEKHWKEFDALSSDVDVCIDAEAIDETEKDHELLGEEPPQLGVCHLHTEHKFSSISIDSLKFSSVYTPDLLKDISTLKMFIVGVYNHDGDLAEYEKAMTGAIETNNIEALECLWQGIYHHDRDNPPYDHHVVHAFAHANLTTIQHCVYAFQNYATLNGMFALSRQALLVTLCQLNHSPDVKASEKYLMSLPHYIEAC
jgi:hypothetical protein